MAASQELLSTSEVESFFSIQQCQHCNTSFAIGQSRVICGLSLPHALESSQPFTKHTVQSVV